MVSSTRLKHGRGSRFKVQVQGSRFKVQGLHGAGMQVNFFLFTSLSLPALYCHSDTPEWGEESHD